MIELEKITEIRTGRLNANQAIEGGKYPFFTCSVNPLRIDDYAYDCECVLVAGNGDLNVKYYNGKFNVYQRVYIVESIDKTKYDVKFLYYFLQTHIDTLRRNSIGGVIKYIRLGDLTNAEVPNFTIETQRKIVSVIEKSEKALVLRKQQTEALSALKQSIFLDMFGDPRTNKYNYPLKSFSFFAEIDTNMINNFDGMEDFPHIGIGNIEKDSGQILSYETVREANIKSGKYLFGPNHIIYSKIRPNLNKVATPNFEGVCSADAYPILVKEDITTKSFFTYLLRSEYFLNYINSVSSRTNIPKVNKKQLEGFKGIYPPFYLQREFSEKVDIIDSNLKMMRDSLEDIEGLYNSLLHKAFNGELFKEEIKA